MAHILLAELALLAIYALAIHITEALREYRRKHVAQPREKGNNSNEKYNESDDTHLAALGHLYLFVVTVKRAMGNFRVED